MRIKATVMTPVITMMIVAGLVSAGVVLDQSSNGGAGAKPLDSTAVQVADALASTTQLLEPVVESVTTTELVAVQPPPNTITPRRSRSTAHTAATTPNSSYDTEYESGESGEEVDEPSDDPAESGDD